MKDSCVLSMRDIPKTKKKPRKVGINGETNILYVNTNKKQARILLIVTG